MSSKNKSKNKSKSKSKKAETETTIKGRITRTIDVDEQTIRFAFYFNGPLDDCPFTCVNELALELANFFKVKRPLEIVETVEKYMGKIGRINSDFKAIRYHDDVKLTNSFVKAFQRLLDELEQQGYISDVQIRPVKVNPSLYSRRFINEGIVTCEVPVAFFKFTLKN